MIFKENKIQSQSLAKSHTILIVSYGTKIYTRERLQFKINNTLSFKINFYSQQFYQQQGNKVVQVTS